MKKQIHFEYNGTEYTLEFTRKTRTAMEDRGFIAADIITKPLAVLPELFAGAFLANHKYIKKDLVEEMFDLFTNKQALVEKLAEMYAAPFEAMMDDVGEGNGIAWDASF